MIIFTFEIDRLLDSIQLQSMYKADTILDQSLTAADDTVVSDDDRDICMGYLKTASTRLAWFLSPYSRALVGEDGQALASMEFDTTPQRQIIFRVEMPVRWDTALAPLMDDSLEKALENYCLSSMAKLRGIAYESYERVYQEALDDLRSYLTQRVGPSDRPFSFY